MSVQASNTPVQLNDEDTEHWVNFIEKLNSGGNGIPRPYKSIEKLIQNYLFESGNILDVGCETGKNSIPLIEKGHKVTLLDIAPNAIQYTEENLKQRGLEYGISESIVGKIEDLDPKYGPFKAVVGTYAFSFIPPHLFEEVMKNNVLGRIEADGFFVGGFFGKEHAWASNPNLSISSIDKIKEILASRGFVICEIDEEIEEISTVSDGPTIFHTINIIAKRTLFQEI